MIDNDRIWLRKVRSEYDEELFNALVNALIGTVVEYTDAWIAYWGEHPVGMASMCEDDQGDYKFTSCGVIEPCRGKGIQRQLIDVRVKEAERCGANEVYTYTLKWNAHSGMNLIREGFELYHPRPDDMYAGDDVDYFRRYL